MLNTCSLQMIKLYCMQLLLVDIQGLLCFDYKGQEKVSAQYLQEENEQQNTPSKGTDLAVVRIYLELLTVPCSS